MTNTNSADTTTNASVLAQPICECGHVRDQHWKGKRSLCTASRWRGKCACDQYTPRQPAKK